VTQMPPSSPRSDAPAAFPIFLDLAGARVLVVGGGEAALAKARLLVPTGAEIIVIDPAPDAAFAAEHDITLLRRAVIPTDLDDVRLCYVALEDAEAAAAIVTAARARGVLVNAVDRPALCDFTTPAMLRRGPVTIAIGTGGVAPSLARDLRARIEAAVPQAFGMLAGFFATWRGRVSRAIPDREARRPFWDAVLDGEEAAAILERQDTAAADAAITQRLARGPAPRRGHAMLVGAGPGDPELLTVQAMRALSRADVVLYDKLVDPRVLDLARRDARRIDVGKRCGRHSMQQKAINDLLVKEVAAGGLVVRLKGGDPFVFGRGGEELEALRAAGAEVTVVPGITAALAIAARLGIPLTHRGAARGLHLITAHGADDDLPAQDWRGLAAAGGTLAVYMGVRTIARVAAALLDAGMPAGTPAIAVENASQQDERRLQATLGSIAQTVAAANVQGPTLVLIGSVVALAQVMPASRSAMVSHAA